MVSIPKYSIRRITHAADGSLVTTVQFSDGSTAILERQHPAYVGLRRAIQLTEEAGVPTGIAVNPTGQLEDVAGAESDVVLSIEERKDIPEALSVWFGTQDGPMLLFREHPRFESLVGQIQEAHRQGIRLWYVTKGGWILDVRLPTSAEEEVSP